MEQVVTTRAELDRMIRLSRRQAAAEAFEAAFELGWTFGVSERAHHSEELALSDAMYTERDAAKKRYLDETWVTDPVAQAPAQEPDPPAASPDLITQLERLGRLRDAGVLNEGEFEAQKARLLEGGD